MNARTRFASVSPEGAGALLARLTAVISAAHCLAEEIEEGTTVEGFPLATALQCVLKEAESIAAGLDAAIGGAQ
jgi:hypothetical protein